MQPSPRHYAVLHHTGIDTPHFDLLFEMESNAPALTTLRCPRWPLELGDVLEELPEHRRAYLEYEGEISGGRGRVARVEAGEVDVAELSIEPPTLGLALRADGGPAFEVTIGHEFDAVTSRPLWLVQTINGNRDKTK